MLTNLHVEHYKAFDDATVPLNGKNSKGIVLEFIVLGRN